MRIGNELPHTTLTRRTLLRALVASALGLRALPLLAGESREVSWLAEVQRPPMPPAALPAGVSLELDKQTVQNLASWKVERAKIRRAWLEFLGPMPEQRPGLQLKILSEDRDAGCLRQLVQYESEPGLPVEGYLLRPLADSGTSLIANGKRPGIVALHATSPTGMEEIAGVKVNEKRRFGPELAQQGFVVFCPRCFLWQNAPDYKAAVANFKARHPQTLGMHKMLWDAMRGVDVLVSLKDEVDPHRIGATGHSLGAKEALYLAAFDERIQAAVASEGGLGFNSTNWDAPWYLGNGIKATGFALNHAQLLALVAPRAFLVLGGESGPGAADGDRSWPYIEAALPVYRLYGTPGRIGLYNHREGHSIPERARAKLMEWLTTYLAVKA